METAFGEKFDLKRLHKAYITSRQMIADRGYKVSLEDGLTFEDFEKRFFGERESGHSKMAGSFVNEKDPTIRIGVFFTAKADFRTVKPSLETAMETNLKRVVLITDDKPIKTTHTLTAEFFKDSPCHVEYFLVDELVFNITRHEYVPKHEMMTQEGKADLLKRYTLKEHQLPRIQKDDPVARYYGAMTGDVFKITRLSETAGRYVTYRIVV